MLKVFERNDCIIVDKRAINDRRLSFAAKGVYVYLLTKPSEIEIEQYKRSDDDFKRGLDELINIKAAQVVGGELNVFDYYQQKIGMSLKTIERDGLIDFIKTTNDLLLKEAINRTALVPKKNAYAYFKRILENWKKDNITNLDELYKFEEKKKEEYKKSRRSNNGTTTRIDEKVSSYKGVDLSNGW